MKKKSRV